MDLSARLARLHAGLAGVIEQHVPIEAAVEAPFHGVSARSALQLAHARGVVLAALGAAGVLVFEYSPATIKKAVTGNGRAEKQQVETMVLRLVRSAGSPVGRSDIADAIAAALCHLFGRGPMAALSEAGVGRTNAMTRHRSR
jgi:crossover junction endodeoxyribonuclease RuvC